MGKHVCPVCETVHAEKGTLTLENGTRSKECESWECPKCGYIFISLTDLQELLRTADKDKFSVTWRKAK